MIFQRKRLSLCLLISAVGLFADCNGMQGESSKEGDMMLKMKDLLGRWCIGGAATLWKECQCEYSSQAVGELLKVLISARKQFLDDIFLHNGPVAANTARNNMKDLYHTFLNDLLEKATQDTINEGFFTAIRQGNQDEIEMIMHYAELNAKRDGKTPLHEALSGCVPWVVDKTVELLLNNNNVDPSIPDNDGCTVLHMAVSSFVRGNASLKTVQKIIARGVSRDVKNNKGQTALEWACEVPSDRPCWRDRAQRVISLLNNASSVKNSPYRRNRGNSRSKRPEI